MKHKLIYSSLLVFCVVFILFYTFNKKTEKHNLLILPYDYYYEPEEVLFDINNFKYLITNDACEENITHIQLVTSYAGNVEARSALRRAYPSPELESLGIARVFLLAVLPSVHEVSQSALINENEKYHDILQGSFYESYRNLTYKHVMGLKWAVGHCKHAKYIIKTDDDILVDMYQLINLIEEKDFQMMGYVLRDMKPIRLTANKWFVTKDEYAEESYPPFLSGWMYVIEIATAKKILSHVKNFKYFWIDDLFVTGLLSREANINMTDIRNLFSLHPEVVECCLRKGLACGFLAAPNGGDYSLQTKFQIHSKHCYVHSCPTLPPGIKLEDRCVAKRKLPKLRKGYPKITVVQ